MAKTPTLALAIMVKNESARIAVTLKTALPFVDSAIVLDTGSDDDTLDIIRALTDEAQKPLHLREDTFVDFSTSRNQLLDLARDKADWLLLLDCNDELRSGEALRQFVHAHHESPEHGYYMRQEWWSGKTLTYFNIRLVRANTGFRYGGVVHEFIHRPGADESESPTQRVPDAVLYQDRTADDDKSEKRFQRDVRLLTQAYEAEAAKDPRTVFYLAQSHECVGNQAEAYRYYGERAEQAGFLEERFVAQLRAGQLAETLGRPWMEAFTWYFRAWELGRRAEPLVKIAEHYVERDWETAFAFISLACRLEFPKDAIMFVDPDAYEYQRWHLLGRIGYYVNEMAAGRRGCEAALRSRPQSSVDKENLAFYR